MIEVAIKRFKEIMNRALLLLLILPVFTLEGKDKLVKEDGDWKLYASKNESFVNLRGTNSGNLIQKVFSPIADAIKTKDKKAFTTVLNDKNGDHKLTVDLFSLCTKEGNSAYYSWFATKGDNETVVCPFVIGPRLIRKNYWEEPKEIPEVKVVWLLATAEGEKWKYSFLDPNRLEVSKAFYDEMNKRAIILRDGIIREYTPRDPNKVKPLFDDNDLFEGEVEDEED